MLGHENAVPDAVDGDSLGVANSRGVSLARREHLIGLVRVEAPDTATGFELDARLHARGLERAILDLAGIRCRADINVQATACVDRKRMHGMVAAQGQAGNDGLRRTLRSDRARR